MFIWQVGISKGLTTFCKGVEHIHITFLRFNPNDVLIDDNVESIHRNVNPHTTVITATGNCVRMRHTLFSIVGHMVMAVWGIKLPLPYYVMAAVMGY